MWYSGIRGDENILALKLNTDSVIWASAEVQHFYGNSKWWVRGKVHESSRSPEDMTSELHFQE
jgi:hypothetical protein